VTYWPKIANFAHPLSFSTFVQGDPFRINEKLKGEVRRTTKSSDFICRQNRPIEICRVSCKNRLIEHVLSSTILSVDFLYIRQQILFMLPWWLFRMEDEYLF